METSPRPNLDGESLPFDRELARRQADGLDIALWWVRGTLDTYVTIEDFKGFPDEPMRLRVPVTEGESPNQVFKHPYAYASETLMPTEVGDGQHQPVD